MLVFLVVQCCLPGTESRCASPPECPSAYTGASTLGKDDVERMVADAERFAGEDKKKREAVDTKNQAESMIYQTEKQLDEFKEKVPEDVKVSMCKR